MDLILDIVGKDYYVFHVDDGHNVYMGPDHGGSDPVALSED